MCVTWKIYGTEHRALFTRNKDNGGCKHTRGENAPCDSPSSLNGSRFSLRNCPSPVGKTPHPMTGSWILHKQQGRRPIWPKKVTPPWRSLPKFPPRGKDRTGHGTRSSSEVCTHVAERKSWGSQLSCFGKGSIGHWLIEGGLSLRRKIGVVFVRLVTVSSVVRRIVGRSSRGSTSGHDLQSQNYMFVAYGCIWTAGFVSA